VGRRTLSHSGRTKSATRKRWEKYRHGIGEEGEAQKNIRADLGIGAVPSTLSRRLSGRGGRRAAVRSEGIGGAGVRFESGATGRLGGKGGGKQRVKARIEEGSFTRTESF